MSIDVNKKIESALEEHKAGNLRQAELLYRKILKSYPNNVDALHLLGVLYHQKGDYDSAINNIRTAIKLDPGFAEAYNNLGNVMRDKGLVDEAEIHYQKALRINPNFAIAHNNLGNIYTEKKLSDKAMVSFKKALQIHPDFAEAYNNLGRVLAEKNRHDEAISYYQKALQLNSTLASAYNNLGAALMEKEQFDEAVTHFQKAIGLNASFVDAYSNLGNALHCKGQLYNAVTLYQKALDLNPSFGDAHFNMSLTLLLSGDFYQGWKEYEWRWKAREFLKNSCIHGPSSFLQPVWDGSYLQEKSLLIYAEQGVGDEVMFASCFEDAIKQIGTCIVECDERLIPIFSRSFHRASFVKRVKNADNHLAQLPRTDMVIPLGSLPKFFRSDPMLFPKKSYLIADANMVHAWIDRFRTIGKGIKIGISWRGGAKPGVIRKRSIKLEQWKKIFSLSGVHFINLQYGDCRNELEEAKEKLGVTIHDWEDVDPLKDLDNFVAQIAALDLIVSVDNSTVHMASALGKPVWVLLPFVPDWRWMLNREDSPWYPAIRLFRQSSLGDWESVIVKVKGELLKLLNKN
jgi:tetratricopeptide (TPR) repeat protein